MNGKTKPKKIKNVAIMTTIVPKVRFTKSIKYKAIKISIVPTIKQKIGNMIQRNGILSQNLSFFLTI